MITTIYYFSLKCKSLGPELAGRLGHPVYERASLHPDDISARHTYRRVDASAAPRGFALGSRDRRVPPRRTETRLHRDRKSRRP